MISPPAIIQQAQITLPSLPALLRAIAQVESRNNPKAVGKHGERTKYQIKWSTWIRYSSRPQMFCTDDEADQCATALALDIMCQLGRRSIAITPRNVYCVWKSGRYSPLGWGKDTIETAERVDNLYTDFSQT